MTYKESPNYREAQRRITLMHRARTPLGRYWHQRQCVEAIKALVRERGKK